MPILGNLERDQQFEGFLEKWKVYRKWNWSDILRYWFKKSGLTEEVYPEDEAENKSRYEIHSLCMG